MAYTDIDKSSDYFEAKLYTGNGGTTNVTGLDFAPNWVWIKSRTSARVHVLVDTVRGVTKRLQTNENDGEATNSNSLTAFNSDGFTLGSYNQSNEGSANFVSWNWKAGTSFSNDASSTSVGTIDSAGSVSTATGFSIISWTGDGNDGATIAHGLGATPGLVITKRRNTTGDWLTGGSVIDAARGGANSLLLLNTTAAMDSNAEVYQTFSSTTFQVGVNAYVNTSGSTMISYCFTEKPGYSKIGRYVGNGNADGTYVYTGFKPAVIICKNVAATQDWIIKDNKRDLGNPVDDVLYPNLANTEDNGATVAFLSNGFKCITTAANTNQSGAKFIYMAFAENPFVTSTGIPGTAR
mgnify:FL=1